MSYEFKSTSFEFKSMNYKFRSTNYEFKSMSYKFQSTSQKTKSTSCKIKSTSWEIKSMSCEIKSTIQEIKSTSTSNKTTSQMVKIRVKNENSKYLISRATKFYFHCLAKAELKPHMKVLKNLFLNMALKNLYVTTMLPSCEQFGNLEALIQIRLKVYYNNPVNVR